MRIRRGPCITGSAVEATTTGAAWGGDYVLRIQLSGLTRHLVSSLRGSRRLRASEVAPTRLTVGHGRVLSHRKLQISEVAGLRHRLESILGARQLLRVVILRSEGRPAARRFAPGACHYFRTRSDRAGVSTPACTKCIFISATVLNWQAAP